MRKIYLITCLSFAVSSSFAQQKTSLFGAQELKKKPAFIETVNTATIVDGTVERGGAFWTENFGTGFTGTNGTWTVGAADGNIWTHSLFAPAGCYSLNTPTPATSTASNGFMLFDADSSNCIDATTTPPTIAQTARFGELISPVIDLTGQPSVLLSFEQTLRYCCTALTLEVYTSTDGGTTWGTPINVLYSLATNANAPNPQTVSVNVSSLIGGSNNAKIKFSWSGTSHYYWAIDDVTLSPAPANDVRLNTASYWNETRDIVFGTPLDYPIVPASQIDNIVIKGTLDNQGSATAANANLAFSVENTATTVVGTGNSTLADLASTSTREDSASWVHSATPSTYTIYATADHDNIGLESVITDNDRTAGTIQVVANSGAGVQWSRDNNTQNGTFIDLDANPYIIGNVFYVYNDITVYSIDAAFMGGSTATDPGVSASVTLFEMDPAATATADVFIPIFSGSTNGIDYTITAPMIGNTTTTVWNKFPLNPANPTAGVLLEGGKQYMAAVEHYGGADYLSLAVSGTTPNSDASAWLYGDGGSGVDWYYLTNKLKIRFGLDNTAAFMGVEDLVSSNLTLGQNVPNPTSNSTSINYSLNESANVNFEIVDITGKVIYSENMGNKGAGLYSMNLNTADYAAGVYYYTMTAGADKLTCKMMVTK
jgi:hypothetical protein